MKPEQQSIAVAKAIGFKITHIKYHPDGTIRLLFATTPDSWKGKDVRPWVPDFGGDLNAMQEAENYAYKHQPVGWLAKYEEALRDVCSKSQYPHYSPICAKPDQRREAFLKSLGLWEVAA